MTAGRRGRLLHSGCRAEGEGFARGYIAGAGEIEGHEIYRLQLWPAEETEPALIKYWSGYDLMRPDE